MNFIAKWFYSPKIVGAIFLFAIFLIKLYPFYLPPLPEIITSHVLAKGILILVFSTLLIKYEAHILKLYSSNRILFLLIFLYFIGQSLSVLLAEDIFKYLKSYHNVIIILVIFFSAYFVGTIKKPFLKTTDYFVVFMAIFIVSAELIFRAFLPMLFPIFRLFAQKQIVDAYYQNGLFGKYSLALGTEMFLPFFLSLSYSLKAQKGLRITALIYSVLLFFSSILSNFRIRVILALFSIVSFLIAFVSQKAKLIRIKTLSIGALALISIIVIFYAAVNTSNVMYSFNILDRFLLENQILDEETIISRFSQYDLSLRLFSMSPIFGVGLGNYANFVDMSEVTNSLQRPSERDFAIATASAPHSIIFQLLAETGLVGLLPFLAVIVFFIKNDLSRFKSETMSFSLSYVISSWSIFLFALFNPADSTFIMGWFWFCRGIIEARRFTRYDNS